MVSLDERFECFECGVSFGLTKNRIPTFHISNGVQGKTEITSVIDFKPSHNILVFNFVVR